jgi:predicted nucleic acid-binding protein
MSIRYFKAGYLDASVAVKLVTAECGSNQLQAYFANHSFFATSFCLFEAFGVLKRKMLKKEISREHYFFACYVLISYFEGKRIRIDDEPKFDSVETFMRVQKFAENHGLDVSDALPLLSVKYGKFHKLAEESKTVLLTSDRSLAKAAKAEGLRVWNPEKESEPPDC